MQIKYKIGFYFNDKQLSRQLSWPLLYFKDNHLSIKLIDIKLFRKNCFHKYGNSLFSDPVLYQEDDGGKVVDVLFLSDIRLSSFGESLGKGFEIYSPFYFFPVTANPCIGKRISTCDYKSYNTIISTLTLDGVDLFPLPDFESFEWRKKNDEDLVPLYTNIFARAIITHYLLRRLIIEKRKDASNLGFPEYNHLPHSRSLYEESIISLRKYIDSINLPEMISDISIQVIESYNNKIGGDYSYSASRITNVSNPIAEKDRYLNAIIQQGERLICEDRGGVTRPRSISEDGEFVGKYQGDALEEEKQKILEKYSKEEHLVCLFEEFKSAIVNGSSDGSGWYNALAAFHDFLEVQYHFDMFKNQELNTYDISYRLHKKGIYDHDETIYELNKLLEKQPIVVLTKKDARFITGIRYNSNSNHDMYDPFRL